MKLNLNTITLTRYNEDKHKEILIELEKDSLKTKFINSIKDRLIASSYNNDFSFSSSYIVEENNTPFGYLYISPSNKDVLFLETAIINKYKSQGYGKRLIEEVSEYLFTEHNIKEIRADIDPSNKKSINMVMSCGFYPDEEEYEQRGYKGKIEFVKDSQCYIDKKRKK